MSIKKIITLVLTVAVVIIALGAISSFVGKETERISPWKFSRGALDENGIYVDSKQSLYTKEIFGCNEMTITVDFEAKLTYDVYFYDQDGMYLGKETGLTETYVYEDLPDFPMYARVVIHPTVPAEEKDFEIKFWEIYEYANGLNIQVAKKQSSRFSGCEEFSFKSSDFTNYNLSVGNSILVKQGDSNFKCIENFDLNIDEKRIDYLTINFYEYFTLNDSFSIFGQKEDGTWEQLEYTKIEWENNFFVLDEEELSDFTSLSFCFSLTASPSRVELCSYYR